jgi:hypothetical protein
MGDTGTEYVTVNADDLATVLGVACLTEHRSKEEHEAMLRVGVRVAGERGRAIVASTRVIQDNEEDG